MFGFLMNLPDHWFYVSVILLVFLAGLSVIVPVMYLLSRHNPLDEPPHDNPVNRGAHLKVKRGYED